jgi:DNA repair photolyase
MLAERNITIMNELNRIFLNYTEKGICDNKCLYCFSQWDIDSSNYSDLIDYKNNVVLYPLCNNDITGTDNIEAIKEYIEKCLSMQSKFSVISLSTKTYLPVSFLQWAEDINKRYKSKGCIKISISFSCKTKIEELEPNAASYDKRLMLIKNIKEHNIPSAVIIKPLLPFIDITEYHAVIDDVRVYTDAIILGGLYVNPDTSFYNVYIKDKYTVSKKKVLWLKNTPLWLVTESAGLIEKARVYCEQKKISCYDSDIDFLNSFMKAHHGHIQ